jgi:hypothetical protein
MSMAAKILSAICCKVKWLDPGRVSSIKNTSFLHSFSPRFEEEPGMGLKTQALRELWLQIQAT